MREKKKERKKEVLIEMQTELMECQMCHVYFNISFLKALQVSILVCLHMNEPFKRFLLNSAPVSENKAKRNVDCVKHQHMHFIRLLLALFFQFYYLFIPLYYIFCAAFYIRYLLANPIKSSNQMRNFTSTK